MMRGSNENTERDSIKKVRGSEEVHTSSAIVKIGVCRFKEGKRREEEG